MARKQTRRPRRSWGKILCEKSGRYRASYVGPDLARHSAPVTFSARMDAEYWLADERRLVERGDWTPPKFRAAQKHARSQMFGEYATGWIKHRNVKPRTRQGYSELLAGPLAKLDPIPLNLLTAEGIRGWFAGLGTKTPTRNSHAYGLLHAILATATSDGVIAANPAKIRGAMNVASKRQPIILTPEQVAKIATEVRAELKAAVLIGAWCGLRWGEMTELRRSDVTPDGSVLSVGRGVTHRAGECHILTPKGGKPRTVNVPPHVAPDIANHLAHHVGAEPDALLFPGALKKCKHMPDRTFRDHFRTALKAVGITENVRIHDMRHTAATTAARFATLAEVQARLGHSTVNAAMRYQHAAQSRDGELAAALSAYAQMPHKTG